MIIFKVFRVAGVAIAATLFGASASATPAAVDPGAAAVAEVAEDALRRLDDPKIAAVTEAINTGEIQHAHLALLRSRSAEVHDFAIKMIVDHDAMRDQQTELLEELGVMPVPSALSARIEAAGEEQSAVLRAHTGLAFDILYLHGQIKAHRTALALLDGALIPSAKEPEFRALLRKARRHVAEHLALARAILLRLGPER